MQLNRKVRPEILDSVALLVLDVQDRFLDTLYDPQRLKKRVAFAIEAARCLKIHTIFTEQAPDKLGRSNQELLKLAHNPKLFSKNSFSALSAPGIERYLREKEIYHLLVVGLEVPICVYQTGLQATEEDVDITFLSDCLGSRRQEDEAPVLATLTRLGCQVLPSETVFYSLLSDTNNPYFQAFNEIVKAFNADDFSLESYLANRVILREEPPRKDSLPDKTETASPRSDSDDGEKKRGRRRGRRRNRGRAQEKSDTAPHNENPAQNAKQESQAPKPGPVEKPDAEPSSKPPATQPVTDTPSAEQPKKSPAKKTARKAAKKATKKTVKKAAKKAAKKAVKKTPPPADAE